MALVGVRPHDPEGLIAYFAHGGLQASSDGGAAWVPLNWTVEANDYPWGLALHPTHPGTLYVGTARGSIHKTSDGGAHWARLR